MILPTAWLDHPDWRYPPDYSRYDTSYLLIAVGVTGAVDRAR